MTVRLLDANGDITTSGQQFTTERDEIAQTVKTRLRLYLGEYFRDITDGTPWWEQILGKPKSQSAAESAIKNRIVRTDGVVRLTSFSTDFDRDTRKFSITCGILTTYGQTDLIISQAV